MSRIHAIPRNVATDTLAYLHETGRIEVTPSGCHLARVSIVRGTAGVYAQVQPKVRLQEALRSRGRPGKSFATYSTNRVVAHQLAYLHATGQPLQDGHEVSHLCGVGACCNPAHLVAETHDKNMSRQRCLGTIVGTLACSHPGCDEAHPFEKLVCSHTPPCLARTVV